MRLELHQGVRVKASGPSRRLHHNIMIPRIGKAAAIAGTWCKLSPWFVERVPDLALDHWRSGRKQWALLETLSLWLQILIFITIVINAWKFGEQQISGERLFAFQSKKLLKYSGVSLLCILLLSVVVSPVPLKDEERTARLYIAALVLLMVVAAILLRNGKDGKTVYGLQHGRLHLNAHVPMWMNMGYWKVSVLASAHRKSQLTHMQPNTIDPSRPKTLAEACRDLLNLLLAEAGFSKDTASDRSRCLIDVGFGCGEQTIHLMSEKPIRLYDKLWWDDEDHRVYFDHYIGITKDKSQHQYAQQRVDEMRKDNVSVFCADASTPWLWSEDLFQTSRKAQNITHETWCLALDTAYHFSPSRWVFFHHMSRYYTASVMAFDLCLSPTATRSQKIVLRILTTLMGAPWANFDTPEGYRQKLIGLGYPEDGIKIIDISDHVFAPLSEFMEEQDRNLKIIGYGLGDFQAAKWLFRWWGNTGLMKGVVVIAKHEALREGLRSSAPRI
jgi:hypothetical protein